MAIEAIALLHIGSLKTQQKVQLDRLDDGTLVHTGASFASEPEGLVEALVQKVGAEALLDHEDARGIFFIPSVAVPKAQTYEGVIEEVGAAGVWAAFGADEHSVAQYGDIGALLGSVFAELPPSLVQGASDFAEGKGGSLEDMAAQVQSLLGSSPALKNLVDELSRDPSKMQQLTQGWFTPPSADDDDDGKPKN